MERSRFRSTPSGAYVAAAAQVGVALIAGVGAAGVPPVESASVVKLSMAQALWAGVLWAVSVIGMWQAYFSLLRKRQEADGDRDRAYVERDAMRAELEKKRTNQALSDLMSDQWAFAVRKLLNQPPAKDGADLRQWVERVRDWERRTVEIMQQYNCTKQDIQSVDIIGLAPWIPGLHPDPASLHALSMLVAQMNRVADIARKYGE